MYILKLTDNGHLDVFPCQTLTCACEVLRLMVGECILCERAFEWDTITLPMIVAHAQGEGISGIILRN